MSGANFAPGRVLITGGAGFIGCNLADRLASDGSRIVVFDTLARTGVEQNLAWLQARHGSRIEPVRADIRDVDAVGEAVQGVDAVFHLAAQVAVTSSLADPGHDFAVNAGGTLTLLEALRRLPEPPPLLFTSTNKVYGTLPGVGFGAGRSSLHPREARLAAFGVAEDRPLDFASPYGCSKGTADQYVLDYARSFGLPTVVFRMSCIYGPRQFGTEDQGWVAHFLKRALAGRSITLYGDGRQVRDVLYVDDLVMAMRAALQQIAETRGRAFNIGGGPERATSLLDLLDRLPGLTGRAATLRFEACRTGDQPWYVSDIRAFSALTGWQPRVGIEEGLARLAGWLGEGRPAEEAAA